MSIVLLMLQELPAEEATASKIGSWFIFVLVLYAGLYVALFVWPVVRTGFDRSFSASLSSLRRRLAEGVKTSKGSLEKSDVSDLVRKKERYQAELDHISNVISTFQEGGSDDAIETESEIVSNELEVGSDKIEDEWEDGWDDEVEEGKEEAENQVAQADPQPYEYLEYLHLTKGLSLKELLDLQGEKEEELRAIEGGNG